MISLIMSVLLPILAGAGAPTTFTMRLVADIPALDWTTVAGDNEDLILKNIMEGLMELGQDGRARPRLAEDVSLSSDGLVYTLHLRKGVKWSDGRELVANDFVESWKRLLSPASTSPNADALDMIAGVREFRRGAQTDFSKVGVQATDPRTLVIRLTSPSGSFLQLLALTSAFPVRGDLLKRHGAAAFETENLVVLGPYRVAEHKPNQAILLTRNPTYYGARPQIEQVRFSVVNDDAVAIQLFKEGKIDLLWTWTSLAASAAPGGAERHSISGADVVYLGLDLSDYPLTLLSARKAIVRAIDRTLLPAALHGPIDVTDSLLPAGIFPGTSLAAPAFNLTDARKLWTDAGLAQLTPPPLELLASDGPMTSLAAETIRAQLEKNLGLKINVQLAPARDYEERLSTLTGSLFIVTRRAVTLDGLEFLDDFLSDVHDNRLHWKNSAYDALLGRAAQLKPGAERAEALRKALQIAQWDDAIMIPLFVPRVAWQIGSRFTGFSPNLFGEVFLRDLRLK